MKKNNERGEISLLGKIFLFFREIWARIRGIKLWSRLSKKQKKLASYNGDANDTSEAGMAYIFGMSKTICITALCILLVLTVIFGGSIISYENVYYMFKDIGYVSSYAETVPSSLNFSKPISNQTFAAFKNGLAVASDSEIKLFTPTGRVTMTAGSEFVNPKMSASGGTLLVYDQGRRGFAVYNSFISVYSKKLDYPISTADMASDGRFAIATKSQKYNSVVQIYGADYSLDMEYSKNDHVLDVSFSDDGKYLSVLSVKAEGGESKVTVNVLDSRKGDIRSTVTLSGVMPYSCKFLSNDKLAIVCQDGLYIYNANGDAVNSFSYPSTLARFSQTDDGLALMFEDGGMRSAYTVTVFDKNGKTVFSDRVQGNVRDMIISGKYLYVLLDGEIVRTDTSFGSRSTMKFADEDARLVAFKNGDAMVCTSGMAYYISFD